MSNPLPPGWKSDVARIGPTVLLKNESTAFSFCASVQLDIPTGQSGAS